MNSRNKLSQIIMDPYSTDSIPDPELANEDNCSDPLHSPLNSLNDLDVYERYKGRLDSTSSLPDPSEIFQEFKENPGPELVTKLQLRVVELEILTQEQQETIADLEMQLLE